MKSVSLPVIRPFLWLLMGLGLSAIVVSSGGVMAQGRSDRGVTVLQPVKTQRVSGDRRVALVIGNGSYRAGNPLANPPNDATDVADKLRRLGFEVILETNADLRTMDSAIDRFAQLLQSGSVGVFYYAGHGIQSEGENYLLPVDAHLEVEQDLRYEALPLGKVLGRMETAGNPTNIILLDACRNNPFARQSRSTQQGLASVDAGQGVLIAYATGPGSVAADGEGRNGTFTAALLEHLQDPLDVELMLKRVRATVKEKTGNRQIPWTSSSLVGDFAFNGGTAPGGSIAMNPGQPPAKPVTVATQSVGTPQPSIPTASTPASRPASPAPASTTTAANSKGDETIPVGRETHRGDRYPLRGQAGQTVEIAANSKDFDTYLILQTDTGEKIAADDDSGVGNNALLKTTLPRSGNYEVIVTSYDEGSSGRYELKINGQSQQGNLSATAPQITTIDVKRGDRYRFNGQAGQSVQISLNSGDFDPYVILQDEAGETIAQNDDTVGGSYNSILHYTLPKTGTYQVVATSYADGAAGSYTLAVNPTEPVNPALLEPSNSTLTDNARVVTKTRVSRGNTMTVQGTQGQEWQISLDSNDFDPYLIVQDQNGEVIGENDDKENSSNSLLNLVLPKTGAYSVIASGYAADSKGRYQLQGVEKQHIHTPFLQQGGSLSANAPLTDTLYMRNADAYTFTGTAGQIVEMTLKSTAFDAFLMLKNAQGETIAKDDDSGGNRNARLNVVLPESGTYRVLARGYEDNSAGKYTFEIHSLKLLPSTILATQGSITDQDPVIPVKDSTKKGDQYTFNGRAGQLINIDLSSADFDTYALLQDADGKTLAKNDDRLRGDSNSRITATLPTTGTYRVVVTSFREDGRGTYALKVQEAQLAETLLPETQGSLDDSKRIVTETIQRRGDRYTFAGKAGEELEIHLNSSEFDPFLVLQNSKGERIAENDDGDDRNSVIKVTLPADDTYTLLASGYGQDAAGRYTLQGDRIAVKDQPLINTTGELNTQSPNITSRYFHQGDAYTFSGQAGEPVNIRLDSKDFDTYLMLQNDRGETLAQDDDGGGGSNSALQVTLPETGTYRVLVTPFNEGNSGAYHLKVVGERLITPGLLDVSGKLGD